MRIGMTISPHNGHTNPMLALARALQARGHDVVVVAVADIEAACLAAGVDFIAFGRESHPAGWIAAHDAEIARLGGHAAGQYLWTTLMPSMLDAALNELPHIMRQAGFDAMVIDKATGYFELAPLLLGVPYVHVWNSAHLDCTGQSPSPASTAAYDSSPGQRAQNRVAFLKTAANITPPKQRAMAFAAAHGLTIDWADPAATHSHLAELTQMPQVFDFPLRYLPAHFYYSAPFINPENRQPVAFPWDQLNGKRIIYASLGTVVNDHPAIYAAIFAAAAQLPDTQLVLACGCFCNPDHLGPPPPGAIIVRYAPQLDLLRRASLCITHAGHNTTLEALSCGVPLVAIPLAFDQPGLAARIAHHGVGSFITPAALTPELLLEHLRRVLNDPAYMARAQQLRAELARLNGPAMAAAVIEQACETALLAGEA